jgi:Tol biopolymer transport system component
MLRVALHATLRGLPRAVLLVALGLFASVSPLLAQFASPLLTDLPDQRLISQSIQFPEQTGNGNSVFPTIDLSGKFVAFQSNAIDITEFPPGAGGPIIPPIPDQIFWVELGDPVIPGGLAGQPPLVISKSMENGEIGDGPSFEPSISPFGRRVAFVSMASNIARPNFFDFNEQPDVYIFDTVALEMNLVSRQVGNNQSGEGASDQPSFGGVNTIVFRTNANDVGQPQFPPLPLPLPHMVAIHNVDTGQTLKILPDPGRQEPPNGDSQHPDCDRSGRFVVFETTATNFPVTTPLDGRPVILLLDTETFEYELVSIDPAGQLLEAAFFPKIAGSDDGSGPKIAFRAIDNGDRQQVFLRDLDSNTTRIVSRDWKGDVLEEKSILNDLRGNFVVFSSFGAHTPNDLNDLPDVFVHDLDNAVTRLVSVSPQNLLAAATGMHPKNAEISEDGQAVAFFSRSPDLLRADQIKINDQFDDVFVKRADPLPEAFSPPSNHIFVTMARGRNAIFQISLDGSRTGAEISLFGSFGGLTVDERNIAWVIDGNRIRRFQALSPIELGVPRPIGAIANYHSIVAADGCCWIASNEMIIKLRSFPDGTLQFAGERPIERSKSVSLALDSENSLWANLSGSRRLRLLKLSRDDLGLIQEISIGENDSRFPFELVEVEGNGDVLVRSQDRLCRLRPDGTLLWSRSVENGDGLAVDGVGNTYTTRLIGENGGMPRIALLGFGLDGFRFLNLELDLQATDGPIDVVVDGEQSVWVLPAGVNMFARVNPENSSIVLINSEFTLLDQQNSNATGFRTANAVKPFEDNDLDGFKNHDEVINKENPFDGAPPADEKGRLPSVQELEANFVQPSVELRWREPVKLCEYWVYRNNLLIHDGPIDRTCDDNPEFVCFIDEQPPPGVLKYRIVGGCPEGLKGNGAGAGAGDGRNKDAPAPVIPPGPSTTPAEVVIMIGTEGAVQTRTDASALFAGSVDLNAVATYDDGGADKIAVALTGNLVSTNDIAIFTLNANGTVTLDSQHSLPIAAPFDEDTIVGMTVDGSDKTTHVMFRDGDLVSFDLDDVIDGGPVPFTNHGNVHPGPDMQSSGLIEVGSRFFTLVEPTLASNISGPGIDCIIGIQIGGGLTLEDVSLSGVDSALSGRVILPDTGSGRVLGSGRGLAVLDSDSMLVGALSGETTFRDLVQLDVTFPGGTATFEQGAGAVTTHDLGGFGTNISDFSYVASADRVVALVSNPFLSIQDIVVMGATFPAGPLVELNVERGRWNEEMSITVTADFSSLPAPQRPAGVSEVSCTCDGEEIPPGTLINDVATWQFTLASPDKLRVTQFAVHSDEGMFAVDYVSGFIRGDGNEDDLVDISDALKSLFCQFTGEICNCEDEIDVDDDGSVGIGDPISLLNFLFLTFPPPAWPFPVHDHDRTEDAMQNCGEA